MEIYVIFAFFAGAAWYLIHAYLIVTILVVLMFITFLEPSDGLPIEAVISNILMTALLWPVFLYLHFNRKEEDEDDIEPKSDPEVKNEEVK